MASNVDIVTYTVAIMLNEYLIYEKHDTAQKSLILPRQYPAGSYFVSVYSIFTSRELQLGYNIKQNISDCNKNKNKTEWRLLVKVKDSFGGSAEISLNHSVRFNKPIH